MIPDVSSRRNKLGLALAGGGFRASLFHLGVLRRMAELDILRHVEVLSTVSGGSIIGAQYILLLKRRLDAKANLRRDDYLETIAELQKTLVMAIQKNLRTRLFWNPLGILRVLLTEHSLAKRMSRLYERYLYRDAVERLTPAAPRRWWRPGRMALRDIRFTPEGRPVTQGLEAYNADPANGSKIPSFILNATSLNSGRPFRFSSVEIGDPRLGFFRYDEIESELAPRKELIQEIGWTALVERTRVNPPNPMVLWAAWWRGRREGRAAATAPALLQAIPELPGALADAEFGLLRRAKLAAWYVLRGPTWPIPVSGGVAREVHVARFWDTLAAIDGDLAAALSARIAASPKLQDNLFEFVLELYYLRTAEVMSPRLKRDFENLALSEAVGASACFPPVFPPFVVLGIYDDLWVTRLGLTDGGVYDNVGISSLLDEDCTYIIASDTSGLFDVEQVVSSSRLGMLARIVSILMDNVAGLQRRGLHHRRRLSQAIETVPAQEVFEQLNSNSGLGGLAFFHIGSPPLSGPGLELGLDRELLCRVRTDLDAFGDVEVAALVNHGYDTADRYLRKYLGNSPFVRDSTLWQPAIRPPIPIKAPPTRIEQILRASRHRFFRALIVRAPLSWGFTVVALAILVLVLWDRRFSMRRLTGVAEATVTWIGDTVPCVERRVVETEVSLGLLVLVAVFAVVLSVVIWPWLVARLRARQAARLRMVVFAVKWLRSYVANALWVLGGAPIWIAFGSAAIAWASYLFFNLPFLARTRTRS